MSVLDRLDPATRRAVEAAARAAGVAPEEWLSRMVLRGMEQDPAAGAPAADPRSDPARVPAAPPPSHDAAALHAVDRRAAPHGEPVRARSVVPEAARGEAGHGGVEHGGVEHGGVEHGAGAHDPGPPDGWPEHVQARRPAAMRDDRPADPRHSGRPLRARDEAAHADGEDRDRGDDGHGERDAWEGAADDRYGDAEARRRASRQDERLATRGEAFGRIPPLRRMPAPVDRPRAGRDDGEDRRTVPGPSLEEALAELIRATETRRSGGAVPTARRGPASDPDAGSEWPARRDDGRRRGRPAPAWPDAGDDDADAAAPDPGYGRARGSAGYGAGPGVAPRTDDRPGMVRDGMAREEADGEDGAVRRARDWMAEGAARGRRPPDPETMADPSPDAADAPRPLGRGLFGTRRPGAGPVHDARSETETRRRRWPEDTGDHAAPAPGGGRAGRFDDDPDDDDWFDVGPAGDRDDGAREAEPPLSGRRRSDPRQGDPREVDPRRDDPRRDDPRRADPRRGSAGRAAARRAGAGRTEDGPGVPAGGRRWMMAVAAVFVLAVLAGSYWLFLVTGMPEGGVRAPGDAVSPVRAGDDTGPRPVAPSPLAPRPLAGSDMSDPPDPGGRSAVLPVRDVPGPGPAPGARSGTGAQGADPRPDRAQAENGAAQAGASRRIASAAPGVPSTAREPGSPAPPPGSPGSSSDGAATSGLPGSGIGALAAPASAVARPGAPPQLAALPPAGASRPAPSRPDPARPDPAGSDANRTAPSRTEQARPAPAPKPPASSPAAALSIPPSTTLAPPSQAAVAPPAASAEPPTSGAEAVAWYEQKAHEGDAGAQHDLAVLYADGSRVPRDYEKSARWFREAAVKGVANAQFNLGVLYENGLGVKRDTVEATLWYHASAEQGHPGAQYNLGVAYAEGRGLARDFDQARRWFEKAAAQGLAKAQYNLAVIHERGLAGGVDDIKAYAWYSLAAEAGDSEAKSRMEQIGKRLAPEKVSEARAFAAGAIKEAPPRRGGASDGPVGGQRSGAEGAGPEFDRDRIAEIQKRLGALGYGPIKPDGLYGERTADAIRRFQREKGMAVDGRPSSELVRRLQQASAAE